MAQRCDFCSKQASAGQNVSHSNRKTKRRFLPNLVNKRIFEPSLGMSIRVKTCTRCLKRMAKTA